MDEKKKKLKFSSSVGSKRRLRQVLDRQRKPRSSKQKIPDELDALEIRDYLGNMGSIFVPYRGSKPAAITINGHRIIIMSDDPVQLEDQLGLVGADRVREIDARETPEETQRVIFKLAHSAKAGVVMAPHELGVADLLDNLKDQLPWIQ